jgi:hypothetical protein
LLGADLDYNYPTTPVGVGYETVPTYFAGVANLRVERYRLVNALKIALCIGSANGFVVDGVHLPETEGDGVKVYGPATGGQVSNVFGFTWDDFCSVHPREYDVFASSYQISDGDVIGVRFSNLCGRTKNAKMFTMYATDKGPIIDGIQVDGVHGGPSAASFGAVISAHCYDPEVQGVIRSFSIRNVTANGPRIFDAINCKIERGYLELAGCRPIDPAGQFILINSASVITKMIVTGRAETTGLTTGRFFDLAGRIDHLVFDNLQSATPGYFLTNVAANVTLGRVTVTSCDLGAVDKVLFRFFTPFVSAPRITIENSRITALHVLETHTPVILDVNNCDLTQSGYLVNGLNPTAGTTTIRVSTRNARRTGGGWISGASNVKYEVFSIDISNPVNEAVISRVDGGFMHNPSVGMGTITQAGIVDCHGTAANSWRVRGDPVAQRY